MKILIVVESNAKAIKIKEAKRFRANALFNFPPRSARLLSHPTTFLLRFSAALAPKFLPGSFQYFMVPT